MLLVVYVLLITPIYLSTFSLLSQSSSLKLPNDDDDDGDNDDNEDSDIDDLFFRPVPYLIRGMC